MRGWGGPMPLWLGEQAPLLAPLELWRCGAGLAEGGLKSYGVSPKRTAEASRRDGPRSFS